MTCTYSSKLCPETFTMVVAPCSRSQGSSSLFKWATPGFCKPIEFSMPEGTSAMRGLALPSQPLRETPFVVTAPKADTSTKSEYSIPAANVPDAVVTGFFIARPPRFTARLTLVSRGVFAAITTPPPGHRRRGRQRRSASCREWFPQRRKGKLRHRTPCASPSTPGKGCSLAPLGRKQSS